MRMLGAALICTVLRYFLGARAFTVAAPCLLILIYMLLACCFAMRLDHLLLDAGVACLWLDLCVTCHTPALVVFNDTFMNVVVHSVNVLQADLGKPRDCSKTPSSFIK